MRQSGAFTGLRDAVMVTAKDWGAWRPHAHLSVKNVANASLCFLVFALWKRSVDVVYAQCQQSSELSDWEICRWVIGNPVFAVSVFLLWNVSGLFWVIGLWQRSFWLIDPFWTWIPFMIMYAYIQHPSLPLGECSVHFYWIVSLLGLWSARLTINYFRREEWKFGEREDWRYTLLARRCGHQWWWISFWAVGFVQQVLLTGLTLPLFCVLFHPAGAWSWVDSVAIVLCVVGVIVAEVADNQLYQYMNAPEKPEEILRSGLWRYSRHPNYFGELLFWWSLCLFSFTRGDVWAFLGPLLNTIIFVETTRMTEKRMLTNWSPVRTALYRKYQNTTSPWIPWFSSWDK